MTRRLVILGSTGSIGTQALEVVEHLNAARPGAPAFEVVGLGAGKNAALLAEQARRFGVKLTALGNGTAGSGGLPEEVRRAFRGQDAAEQLVREARPDLVLAAMVGAAGLPATLAAIELGADVALANKETLVAAGALVVEKAAGRVALLPVDSEHSAVWRCLLGARARGGPRRGLAPPWEDDARIARITLTASGGPFREWPRERIARATREEALRHPTWSMGGKITIDSATLMNKALEVIEAHWLFGVPAEKLAILVHPRSVVHAFVETADGSVLCQMGTPDMRAAIQFALVAPEHADGLPGRLDLASLGTLEFEPPDAARFPAVNAWRACIGPNTRGTTAGAILNAANEEGVARFLEPDRAPLAFPRIAELALEALATVRARPARTLSDVLASDAEAREFARSRLG